MNTLVDWPVQALTDYFPSLPQEKAMDYVIATIIAILFPIVRYILDKTVYHWLACFALRIPSDLKNLSKDTLDRYEKFKESAYKCGVQIAFSVVILYVALPKAWFWNLKLCYSECFDLPCMGQIVSPGERFIYRFELAFYSQAIPMIFLWETKRHDRWQLFAHHVATVILIGYSYYLHLLHIGVLVLACHEMNDIFLEAAKMARYAKAPEWMSVFWFIMFALSWFATRIYAFGFIVIRSTLADTYERAKQVGGVDIEPHVSILNGLLIFLYLLHIYWSYLIMRIIVKSLTPGGKLDDIREEDDEGTKKEE
ncbi:hypothetical protein M9434_004868 [Picochlorum sp. BPE23]|nr:hypothetical protein M9434_004868 [Picochlorum sp. BPE23]